MSDLNIYSVCGRLTNNQEIKYTNAGYPVGTFSIAVNETQKKDGQNQKYTSFFDVSLFGKVAESLSQYLVKGKQVNITGRLRQERWVKDGKQNQKIKILADTIQLLGGGNSGNNQNNTGNQSGYQPDKLTWSKFQDEVPW